MKARTKSILRGIKGSLNRFLSILFIVALGAGFMAGLAATSPDMYDTVDAYMDRYSAYDIDVKSPVGITAQAAEKLSSLDFVEKAMPAKVVDLVLAAELEGEEHTYTARVYATIDNSVTAQTDPASVSDINAFRLVRGTLPVADDECVVQSPAGKYLGGMLDIGDVLTVSDENSLLSGASNAKHKHLKVVGIVNSPLCLSIAHEYTTVGTGTISLDVYTKQSFFTHDYYTDVFLTVKGAKALDCFSDEYKNLINSLVEEIGKIGDEYNPQRVKTVSEQLDSQIQSLDTLVGKLQAASRADGQLTEDDKIRAEQMKQLAESLQGVDPQLAQTLIDTANAVLQSSLNANKQTEQAIAALTKQKEQISSQKELLSLAVWSVNSRADSVSFSTYESNVGKVAALSKVFPVFFFFVALLVALTTMTRLVEENRGQIGTLKALGYSNWQILSEYLLYGFFSSLLGCVLGFTVGFKLFPWAISSAYAMMFTVPTCVTPIRWEIIAWVAPVTISSIILATLWACWSEFVAKPSELMRPKAPPAGKRIFLERIPFVWNHLKFTQKVTCRNLFRYKKRLFMTIIGIAGCSALLLTGFGIKDSVNDIVDKQFGEIFRYQATAMASNADWKNDEQLSAILSDGSLVKNYVGVMESNGRATVGDKSEEVTISVPERTSDFGDFICLRTRVGEKPIEFPQNGVVLTEKLCNNLSLKVGDKVTLKNADGYYGTVTVAGIAENHVMAYAYMTAETYAEAFGITPVFSSLLICTADGVVQSDFVTELMQTNSILYASTVETLRSNFDNSIKSIDGVILVLILSAGLLSFVVLYNLTNVNICERRKELATIRVLGFHKKEVERYIFREINILAAIGTLVGLLIGIWLHSFVVTTVEVDQVMFGRTIHWWSYLFAVGISAVFTFIVNLVMKRIVRKVDMVEAMKSAE